MEPRPGNESRRWAILVLLGVVSLTGCSASGDVPLVAEPPTVAAPTTTKIFTGTPEEATVLTRACYEEHGIKTSDTPDGDPLGFGFAHGGRSDEELEALSEACEAEVGVPKMAGLTEQELRDRYAARLEQYECIVAAGYSPASPPSFDRFVDDYERSGQAELWEPAALPTAPAFANPAGDCPRTSQW